MKTIPAYFVSCCLFLISWGTPVTLTAQEEPVLVIEGGTLLDGNGGEPVSDSLIIIRGNRIESVSRKGEEAYPAGSRVLQANGKFILPGLMDAHCHYRDWMPELMLAHGVTGVFEIGGGGRWGLAQRDGIAKGKIPGPRLYVAVTSLAGAQIAAVSLGRNPLDPFAARQVIATAEEARQLVRQTIETGTDMIKVHRGPPVEVYAAAAEEAHRAGLPVVGQPLGPTVYAREAALAGVDGLEHAAGVSNSVAKDPGQWKDFGNRGIEEDSIDPTPFADMDAGKVTELIQLLVEQEVWLEPDFIAVGRGFHKDRAQFELQDYRVFNDPNLAYVPRNYRFKILGTYHEFDDLGPQERERRNLGYQNMLRFIRQFAQAGGTVLAGTDTSGWAVPGLGMHHELQILVEEAGLSPMQAIQSATRNVAKGFRILDRVGTVEAGKLADLLIVEEDPLENIRNTLKIKWVLKDGQLVDRTYHGWFKNPLPQSAVEAPKWVQGLKAVRWQTNAFGQPTPGIETLSPVAVSEGSPALNLTLKGVNFTKRSTVTFNDRSVPVHFVSGTELGVQIGAELIAKAGTYPITVTNPEPLQILKWGGTSNKAYLMVTFR